MKWYWLFVILSACVRIVGSDAKKRATWLKQADDPNAPNIDRLDSLLSMALAVWQCIVLWWPR